MPKRCSFCNCSTLNVPTFRVTKKRIESWSSKTNKNVFIGDRVCQSHFLQADLKTHVISNLQNSSSSSRTILKEGATPLLVQSPTSLDDSVDEIMALPLIQNSPNYLELKSNSSELILLRKKKKGKQIQEYVNEYVLRQHLVNTIN
ncbi:uncharacterized protein LOC111028300 isoform X2 [Myzus persicae]|uniref:uncharacterized protein LOC111028300 isoform X2 n=1 Tax=Myzus persicae TaxID=13164 RepID=UPI000B939DA6|nr:uncharacterized protein LOC111028300 isoform X2 [Myzus persicae]